MRNAGISILVFLALTARCCLSLHCPTLGGSAAVLRIRGGASASASPSRQDAENAASDTAKANLLKESAARRLQQAKAAGKGERTSISKTIYRAFAHVTNRLGLTGATTRIVNGKIVLSRNPVQKLFHLIYLVLRAIYLFFKTLVVPVKSLDEPKPSGGPGRGSFNQLNKKREMRMADLPPMPGG